MIKMDPSTPIRDMGLLMPEFARRCKLALDKCNELGYPVATFESWRSPSRQSWLYEQGRSRPGKIVTNSKAWGSWHNYGLAQDCAIRINGKWSWEFDWAKVAPLFIEQGLSWLNPFEQCHFEMTGGLKIKDAYEITQKEGVQALWLHIGK